MSSDDKIKHGIPLADPDGLDRWREDAERRDREFARDRRQQQRERRADVVEVLRAEFKAEIAALRAETIAYREVQTEAYGQALGEFNNKTMDQVEQTIKKLESMFWTQIERGFARLHARIDVLSDGGSRAKEFKFASEREGEDSSEPTPTPRRGDLN
jgi:tRNA nucleotidyltransferase/poly(A) polymerase